CAHRVYDLIQLLHDVGGGTRLIHVAVQREAEPQRLMRETSVARIDREAMNLLRHLGRDLFDVHAARRAHHQHGPLRRAIDDDPDVTLRCNRRRGSDEHFVNGETLDRHAENRSGVRLSFGGAVCELYTAGLTAPARMHLRLHDDLPLPPPPPAKACGAGAGLAGSGGDFARRDGNAVAPQDVPSLILMQVHVCSFAIVVPASPRSAARPSASSAIMARSPPVRTNSAAASTLGRMLPVPSSFPVSRWSACARVSRRIASWCGVPKPR